jgi:hypothetical protein
MFPTPCVSATGAGAGAWVQPTSEMATARTSVAFILLPSEAEQRLGFTRGFVSFQAQLGLLRKAEPNVKDNFMQSS